MDVASDANNSSRIISEAFRLTMVYLLLSELALYPKLLSAEMMQPLPLGILKI